jgi:hypothetical protein
MSLCPKYGIEAIQGLMRGLISCEVSNPFIQVTHLVKIRSKKFLFSPYFLG